MCVCLHLILWRKEWVCTWHWPTTCEWKGLVFAPHSTCKWGLRCECECVWNFPLNRVSCRFFCRGSKSGAAFVPGWTFTTSSSLCYGLVVASHFFNVIDLQSQSVIQGCQASEWFLITGPVSIHPFQVLVTDVRTNTDWSEDTHTHTCFEWQKSFVFFSCCKKKKKIFSNEAVVGSTKKKVNYVVTVQNSALPDPCFQICIGWLNREQDEREMGQGWPTDDPGRQCNEGFSLAPLALRAEEQQGSDMATNELVCSWLREWLSIVCVSHGCGVWKMCLSLTVIKLSFVPVYPLVPKSWHQLVELPRIGRKNMQFMKMSSWNLGQTQSWRPKMLYFWAIFLASVTLLWPP